MKQVMIYNDFTKYLIKPTYLYDIDDNLSLSSLGFLYENSGVVSLLAPKRKVHRFNSPFLFGNY